MLISNGMAWILYFIKIHMTIRYFFIKFVFKRTLIELLITSLNEQEEAFKYGAWIGMVKYENNSGTYYN